MSFLEERAQDYNLKFNNSYGSEIAVGQLVLVNEQFGELIGKYVDEYTLPVGPVPNGDDGIINTAPMREIQTSQLGAGTFPINAKVYMAPGIGDLVDAIGGTTRFVGIVTKAKGSDDWIRMRTVVPLLETT
jgi:hypothetical protein